SSFILEEAVNPESAKDSVRYRKYHDSFSAYYRGHVGLSGTMLAEDHSLQQGAGDLPGPGKARSAQ
ncbi:hypothetical protein, partial [Bradyrhizobium sp. CCBAU 11357]|uniref:hypothetical protein n=1 Tax=Bradyrhizobium sp. CCBAU 11357 TaxID=1630808 RepID=UPI002303BCB6